MTAEQYKALIISILVMLAIATIIIFIAIPIQNLMIGIPIIWGNYLTIITCIAMTAWAWIRTKNFIFEGALDKKPWRDLRLWTTIFMGFQIYLYWWLR